MTEVTDSTMVAVAPNADVMDSAAGTVAGSAVAQYLQFVDARSCRAAGTAHDYTADGPRELTDPLNEVASGDSVGGMVLQPQSGEIRQRADAMQRNPNATEHSLQAREAFTMVSSAMVQMKRNASSTGAGNLDALLERVMAIEPSTPMLDQANQLEQFFSLAGDALRNAKNATAM